MTVTTATPAKSEGEASTVNPIIPAVREHLEGSGQTFNPDQVQIVSDYVRSIRANVEAMGVRAARDNGWCGVFGQTMRAIFPDGPLDGVAWRDANGMDCNGYDRDGYRNGYDASGYDRDGFNVDGWDREGYNRDGLNRNGFNREGRDRFGCRNEDYTYNTDTGCEVTSDGYRRDGYHHRTGLDRDGYNMRGYDADGYNRDGFDRTGYNRDGLNRGGYGRDGFHPETGRDVLGFDREGFNEQGYDRVGYHRETGRNWQGFDRDGYNDRGVDRYGNPRPAADPRPTVF